MALGCGPVGSVAMSALRKSRNPSAVREGKESTEVRDDVGCEHARRGGSELRIREGWRLGPLSGMVGMPAKSERRTVTGVEVRWICGAWVSEAASMTA